MFDSKNSVFFLLLTLASLIIFATLQPPARAWDLLPGEKPPTGPQIVHDLHCHTCHILPDAENLPFGVSPHKAPNARYIIGTSIGHLLVHFQVLVALRAVSVMDVGRVHTVAVFGMATGAGRGLSHTLAILVQPCDACVPAWMDHVGVV